MKRVYLDNAATTPLSEEVIKEIDKEGSVDIIDSCVARISEKWFIIKRNSNRF